MSHSITTLVAIYAKKAETFTLDRAICKARPDAQVESRYLDKCNNHYPHDEDATERGFDVVTNVKIETPRGPAPRFTWLFEEVLKPFLPLIEVHCIERNEENLPDWVTRFDVEPPWREVECDPNEVGEVQGRSETAIEWELSADPPDWRISNIELVKNLGGFATHLALPETFEQGALVAVHELLLQPDAIEQIGPVRNRLEAVCRDAIGKGIEGRPDVVLIQACLRLLQTVK